MSSRALRRAQRELEEKRQLEQLEKDQSEAESEEGEEDAPTNTKSAVSMFALLGQEDADEDDDSDAEASEHIPVESDSGTRRDQPNSQKSKKKKKKKKKKKGKALKHMGDEDDGRTQSTSTKNMSPQLDEIDLALRSLSMGKPGTEQDGSQNNATADTSKEFAELYGLLSVDTQHLHVSNEMRRLFGRAAMENERPQDDAVGGRRRGRGDHQGGLAGAIAGRDAPGGRNLTSLGLRKNIFIQGKEEWPRSTSGGLSMEIVQKNDDGTVEYRFVHNTAYQDVQRQFDMCVASMEPDRMVQLLQNNPYHISTLLQVSEIASHQRDYAVAGNLLERALFSFGRSVHSSFSSNISQGKARLDFRRPENREFWLAAWRYITNLGMRSTWRTAMEWAQLLLSLDPDWDPYCICLVIDQFAIRARQPHKLLQFWNSKHFHDKWQHLPNVAMTVGLARIQSGEASQGRSILREAIEQHPWVAGRLFQELNIEPLPPKIWGKTPPHAAATLFTELYATRAKDVWNTPESSSLLAEVAHAADPENATSSPAYNTIDPLDYTRHVLLTDKPELIALLDRSITSRLTSTSDPLPPVDNITSYDASSIQSSSAREARHNPAGLPPQAWDWFRRNLAPWTQPGTAMPDAQTLRRRLEENGMDPQSIDELVEQIGAGDEMVAEMARNIEEGQRHGQEEGEQNEEGRRNATGENE